MVQETPRHTRVGGSRSSLLPLAYGKVTIVYTRAYTQLSGLRLYARIAHGQTQDILMPHLVMSSARKLLLFLSSTRTDRISPFEAFFGRKADTRKDIGPPFGSYCQVTARVLSNNMDPRTIGCLYLEPKMNGTGTNSFMRIDTRSIISANHYVVLPIPTLVTTTINGWASKN